MKLKSFPAKIRNLGCTLNIELCLCSSVDHFAMIAWDKSSLGTDDKCMYVDSLHRGLRSHLIQCEELHFVAKDAFADVDFREFMAVPALKQPPGSRLCGPVMLINLLFILAEHSLGTFEFERSNLEHL